jgi:DNA-binding NarL/FixJ family response regulator
MGKIRILIVEDHKLVRETWSSLLNLDRRFEVIAAFSDSSAAILFAQKEYPDIILMDINILPLNGFQATARLSQISPDFKVIGLSFHSEIIAVQKMLAAGAMGYLTKNSGYQELTEAIVRVHEGGIYICSEIREKGFEVAALSQMNSSATNILTHKEIQISHFIHDGLRSKEIADKMNISVRTVSVHRYNIFRKLNINSSVSLVRLLNSNRGHVQYAVKKNTTIINNLLVK